MVSELPKLKLRKPKKKRTPKPALALGRMPAWLTRCPIMGYEVWSEKPEFREGRFCHLLGWENDKESTTCFYFRLPSLDAIPISSPMYLNKGIIRRIWLNMNLVGRKMTHAAGTQEVEAKTYREG